MINYTIISVLIYIILVGIIVLLSFFLFRKRQKTIRENNSKIIKKKIMIEKIEKLTIEKKNKMEKKINEATNFNDYINVFIEL